MRKGLLFALLIIGIIIVSGCTSTPNDSTISISDMLLTRSDVENLGFNIFDQKEIDIPTIKHCTGFISVERTSFMFTDKDVMDEEYNIHPGIINEIAEFSSKENSKACFSEKKKAKIDFCEKYPKSCNNKELIQTPIIGDDSIIEKSTTSDGISYGIHFVSGNHYAYVWILTEEDITLNKFVQLSRIVENKMG